MRSLYKKLPEVIKDKYITYNFNCYGRSYTKRLPLTIKVAKQIMQACAHSIEMPLSTFAKRQIGPSLFGTMLDRIDLRMIRHSVNFNIQSFSFYPETLFLCFGDDQRVTVLHRSKETNTMEYRTITLKDHLKNLQIEGS